MHRKMQQYMQQVEEAITQAVPERLAPAAAQTIVQAMRYSLQAGGKRLRPVLLLEFCHVCGGDITQAMPFAVALEMIHTYSLIHDDLPCMDNDDLRRGKPTSHKVFGEAMAVLAGDALLTQAMHLAVMGSKELPHPQGLLALEELTLAAGTSGMLGGQVMDLESENKQITLDQLRQLQELKTGALLQVACQLGCIVAGKTDHETLLAAKTYGMRLGRAFQIQDDILDVEGNSHTLGKTIGKDASHQKATFPALLGLARCHELVQEETQCAIYAAKGFEDSAFLIALAESLMTREH